MGTTERPEVAYAVDPAENIWPENWVQISEGTLARNRRGWQLGFLAAHDIRLHSATTDVPLDVIKSDVIQRVGRHLLSVNREVWGGTPVEGSGLTANQVDLSEFTPVVPSMSIMWVGGELRLVVNPSVTYPEGYDKLGDTNLGSEGCMNIRGLGAHVPAPNWLTVQGYTLDAKPLEIEVTDPLECRTVQHEDYHNKGELYTKRVLAAGRPLYRVNAEQFALYQAWWRGEDVGGWSPDEMPEDQYQALVDPTDPRMKLERFTSRS